MVQSTTGQSRSVFGAGSYPGPLPPAPTPPAVAATALPAGSTTPTLGRTIILVAGDANVASTYQNAVITRR